MTREYTPRIPLNVSGEIEKEIQAKVRAGEYSSADELIREGLDLIKACEDLRRAIEEGAAQLDRLYADDLPCFGITVPKSVNC